MAVKKIYDSLNRAMKRGFNAVFFSCRDLTEVDCSNARLTQRPGFRIRRLLHLCLCRFCRAYQRQVKLVDKQTEAFSKEFPEDDSVKLSTSSRDGIRERLRDSLKNSR